MKIMRCLKLNDGTMLVRSFLPVERGGSGVVEYYIGIEKSLLVGIEKIKEITPVQAFEIACQYKHTKEGRKFIKEMGE